jgi:hypothetical protein
LISTIVFDPNNLSAQLTQLVVFHVGSIQT